MAVIARAEITLASIRDIQSVTRYYLLQSSTASAPSKPAANPPGGDWVRVEPSYTSGSTNSLYFTDLTVFTDDTFAYSDVSLSSSYEAAKQAYNKAEATQAELDNLEIGGRNLMIGTLNPDVSANSALPRILGQTVNTAFSTGTKSVAEHGFRITNTDARRPMIRFGSTSTSTGTLIGLEPGETYTLSFDAGWKLFSGDAPSTTYYLRIYLYNQNSDESGFSALRYESVANITQDLHGVEGNKRQEFTFTIPEDSARCYLLFQMNISTAAYYAAGDYLEMANIKLEKGNRATAWTPAPEDLQSEITASAELVKSWTQTKLEQSEESILASVSSTYYTKTAGESLAGDVDDLLTWQTTASQKITDSAIVNTVTSSSTYINALSGKVNTADLTSLIGQWWDSVEVAAEKVAIDASTTIFGQNLATVTEHDPDSVNVVGYYSKTFTVSGIYLTTNSGGVHNLSSYKRNPLAKGDTVYWSFRGVLPSASSVKVCIRILYFDIDKTLLGNDSTEQFTMSTTEELYSGTIELVSDYADSAAYIQIGFYPNTNAVTKIRQVCVYRQDGAVRIADGSITAGMLAANCITSGQLASSVTEMLTAGSSAKTIVDANKANWDSAYSWVSANGTSMSGLLSMVKKWTNDAVSDATMIQGGWIATNTITAQHMAVGDFANLCEVNELEEASADIRDGAGGTTYNLDVEDGYLKMPQLTGNLSKRRPNFFKTGDKIYYTLTAKRTKTTAQTLTLRIRFYDASGTTLGTRVSDNIALTTSDAVYTGTMTLAGDYVTGAAKYAVFLDVNTRAGGYPVWLKQINVYRQASQVMISDGAITADKIAANAVTAGKLAAGAVTAGTIAAGAVTASVIDVSNLSAISAYLGSWHIHNGYLYSESDIIQFNSTSFRYRTYLLNYAGGADYAIGVVEKTEDFDLVDPQHEDFIWGIKNDGSMVAMRGLSLQGGMSIQGGLSVDSLTLASGATVSGSATFLNALTYNGTSTFNNDATFTRDVYLNTNAILGSGVKLKQIVDGTARELFGYGSQLELTLGQDGITKNIIACIGNSGNGGSFRPVSNGQTSLGTSSYRWSAVYAANGVIQTSDEQEKDAFENLSEGKYKELFMAISPIAFRWKDGRDGFTHFGIGAQTFERDVERLGLMDIAAVRWDDGAYGVSYTELQMLTVPVVQAHEQEIEQLKERVAQLERRQG